MPAELTLEVCIDSVAGARAAASARAHRVELCSDLIEGGITPSYGLIKTVRDVLSSDRGARTKLVVLIRPRGGDFLYNEDELTVMLADIAACSQLGADGVVFGCLLADGQVDVLSASRLLQAARYMALDVTFHRAFDVSKHLGESLDALIRLGIGRVLTSGGQPSAVQGAHVIAGLVKQAAGRISIMAGGGVTASNAADLLAGTGVHELHSSAKMKHQSIMQYRPPHLSMSTVTPLNDYEWNCTSEEEVTKLLEVLNHNSQAGGT